MNYLAHSFLAFSEEQIVGQFLEDIIPNRDRFSYPRGMQEGITLHREIDTFTDAHPELREAKKIFSPLVRLYAGAFVDVSMDYFLANSLTDELLRNHAENVYQVLRKYEEFLSPLGEIKQENTFDKNDIKVIICVSETIKNKNSVNELKNQILDLLEDVKNFKKIIT